MWQKEEEEDEVEESGCEVIRVELSSDRRLSSRGTFFNVMTGHT